MKEIIKNTLVLFAITLVAGLLLGIVYEVTKAPRKKQEELAKQRAYAAVFKDADNFKEQKFDKKKLEKFLSKNGIKTSMARVEGVVLALDKEGNALGYVITVTDKEGYGGDISLTVGIKNNKTVNGISILTINETAGLGMEADNPEFLNQYIGKKVDSFNVTKTAATSDDSVEAISGATITTNAVTDAINAALLINSILAGGN